jgi:hypothetical protein
MRGYIFTPLERSLLKKYLEDGVRGDGFRTLMTRIRQNAEGLREDIRLLDAAFEKHHEKTVQLS